MIKIISLFTFLISFQTFSSSNCDKELAGLPVQTHGREKPLLVHAKSTIKKLTGKSKYKDYNPVCLYTDLSLSKYSQKNVEIEAKIQHIEVKKILDLDEDAHTISFQKLLENKQALVASYMSIKEENSLKKYLNKTLVRIELYEKLKSGKDFIFPLIRGKEVRWVSVFDYSAKGKDELIKDIKLNAKNYTENFSDKYLVELTYAKLGLSHWSMLFSILALATLFLFKNFNITIGLSALTILLQTAILVFRTIISGRAPITNMYETVLFSGYGALFLAMIIGHFKKEKLFVCVGLCYNVMTLMMLNFADGMLTEEISPLVPVLRDNFWLSTHVTTIILSYGALALSWVMSNAILIKRKWGTLTKKDDQYYSELTYTCIKYGATLLAAGIILGGVWADYSWGRFWGWDPKETWSLIVLCIYMAILHGKYTNWISNARFTTCVAGAFLSVMMAWFGVNYILASGLHSYGFSEGGAIFLGTFFLVQTILLIITFKKEGKVS